MNMLATLVELIKGFIMQKSPALGKVQTAYDLNIRTNRISQEPRKFAIRLTGTSFSNVKGNRIARPLYLRGKHIEFILRKISGQQM